MSVTGQTFVTAISKIMATLGHTNHLWVPVMALYILLRLTTQRHFRQRWGRALRRFAIAGLISYLVALGLIWAMQPRLLFKPTHILQTTPASHNLQYEEIWIPANADTQQPERLHSWWIPQPKDRIGTLIYFHGANLNIGFNVTQAYWLRKLGFDILLAEYRGYGLSEGDFPTEKTFYEDANAALVYLTQQRGIPLDEIFVYGHSLGGAIAIDLASKHPNLAGLIVQNSFTTMSEMVVRSHYAQWFPVRWILNQRFDSLQKVRDLEVPLFITHTTGDPLIPVEMGKRLYKAARSRPKELILVDAKTHHNVGAEFKSPEYLAKLKRFAVQALSVKR
ncbi:MAG: alpha/beta fold hydrolase [Cyanobacteria bacterium P01_G01_bin.38]